MSGRRLARSWAADLPTLSRCGAVRDLGGAGGVKRTDVVVVGRSLGDRPPRI
jgi:hypothetical protein